MPPSSVTQRPAVRLPPEGGPTPGRRGFWVFAALLTLFPMAASAPSPLYADYATRWQFSDTTLTLVFAVYAAPLLIALLVFGSFSDEIGRKPVTLVAAGLLAASLTLFITADGLTVLIAARALQGFATGLLTAVASAALLDLQPSRRPGLASLLGAALSTGGLGLGALLSGFLVQYAWGPSKLTYLILLVALGVLAIAAASWADETVTHRIRPRIRVRVSVPAEARPIFLAATPCLISTWALISFYLSLGPKLVTTLSHASSHLPGAISVALLTGLASLVTLATKNWASRTSMVSGCAVLAAGSGLTVAAIAITSPAVFYLSTVIAGIGFGLGFSGAFRSIVALADPTERGALVAATYVLGYTAFGIPAIIAGIISTHEGLRHTAIGYSAVVAGLALIALLSTHHTSRRSTPAGSH